MRTSSNGNEWSPRLLHDLYVRRSARGKTWWFLPLITRMSVAGYVGRGGHLALNMETVFTSFLN